MLPHFGEIHHVCVFFNGKNILEKPFLPPAILVSFLKQTENNCFLYAIPLSPTFKVYSLVFQSKPHRALGQLTARGP